MNRRARCSCRLAGAALALIVVSCGPGSVLLHGQGTSSTAPPAGPVPLQTPEWPRLAIDLHGATSNVPSQAGFYPPLPAETAIPSRGFGLAAGAHTYPRQLGPARLGLGVRLTMVRATLDDAVVLLAVMGTPQISFNFGTPLGWSYVSGGVGAARLRGRLTAPESEVTQSSGGLTAWDVGGGARWFFRRRVAFSFDLRLHRLGSGDDGRTEPTSLGAASVGLTFR